MARRRTLFLGTILVGAAGIVALLFLLQWGQKLTGSTPHTIAQRQRDAESERIGGSGAAEAAGRLNALIQELGGCAVKGRLRLTLPEGPGANLPVQLKGTVKGMPLSVAARSDAAGRFSLPTMPQASGYVLSVAGERVQPFRLDVDLTGQGPERDLGDLSLKRYYFVVGRVVAEAGQGVSGAEVALVETAGFADGFSMMDLARHATEPDPSVASTQSGKDGRFSLRLDAPGRYTLRTQAKGYATSYLGDVFVGGIVDVEVTVALTRGYLVAGTVLDSSGYPMPGVSVAVFRVDLATYSFPKDVTATDATGRFSMRVEPSTGDLFLLAAPKKGPHRTVRFQVPLSQDLIVRMPGAGALSGRVVDGATGQPVAGAEVLIGLTTRGTAVMGFPDVTKSLQTDAVGAFRLEQVGGTHIESLTVRAEGHAVFRAARFMGSGGDVAQQILKTAVAAQGETPLPEIPLQAGHVLVGHVTDASTQAPIAGASVQIWNFLTGNRGTTTDTDGMYRLEGVGDRTAMAVSAPGYAPFRDPPYPGYSVPDQSGPVTRDFALKPGGTVAGAVVAKDGSPVSFARVQLQGSARGRAAFLSALALRDRWTYTDDKGRYEITGVPPGKIVAVAQAHGFDRGESKPCEVLAGTTARGVDITLLPGARIAGRIVQRDGTPVSGASITVGRDPGADADTGAQWRALMSGKHGFGAEDGTFSVPDIPVGDVIVRINADGFATKTVHVAGVQPGEDLTNRKFEMAPAYTITGRVVDDRGHPVLNCWVRAEQTDAPGGVTSKQLLGARVEANGTFVLKNLPEGTYRLTVNVNNFLPNIPHYENLTQENVQAGTTGLVLKLQPQKAKG